MRTARLVIMMALAFSCLSTSGVAAEPTAPDLGKFSVSLSVKDMKKSIDFYQKLGFKQIGGDAKKWAFMQSGTTYVGLFHGLFEGTGLTFNPSDVRSLQKQLKTRGVHFEQEAPGEGSGPASAVVKDPDGNVILFDQY